MSTDEMTKSGSEVTSPQPNFSYAQAAKGRSKSASASGRQAGPQPGSSTPTKDPGQKETANTTASANGSSSTDTLEVAVPSQEKLETPEVTGVDATLQSTAAASQQQVIRPTQSVSNPGQRALSTPSSPSLGTASTSTLPKEDDSSATPNASSASASTWDKQSQASVNPDKASEVPGRSRDGVKDETDDKEPENQKSKVLMAAPVPSVNIWQQRKDAQAAKAKAASQIVPPTPTAATRDHVPTVRVPMSEPASNEMAERSSVPDPRRRPKGSGGHAEEATRQTGGISAAREKKKSLEGSVRTRDEITQRPIGRGRVSEKDGLRESSIPTVPPPVQDSMSWPTPDKVEEDKKKVLERNERTDKEKMPPPPAKSHGKEKWTTVPYTPSVIFETQLPTLSQRGSRRPGRGGRDSMGGRGAHVSSGSIGGADKTGVGIPQATASASPMVNTSHGQTESSEAATSTLNPRSMRRASSAGAHASKEHRRSLQNSSTEKNTEGFDPAAVSSGQTTPSIPASSYHRTSTATQTEAPARIPAHWKPGSRTEADGVMLPSIHTNYKGDQSQPNEYTRQTHPKSAPLDRDGSNRAQEYQRDNATYLPPRERAEGRSDRGRSSYRAHRGGGNGFATPQLPVTTSFVNGHQGYDASPGSFQSARGSSFTPHHHHQASPMSSHTQSTANNGYGANLNRHTRGNSRSSQSHPGSASSYGAFSGHPTGAASMAPIQTQFSPIYDYPTLQTMSAVPFSPYVEQFTTLSMVAMQLDYYFSVDNLCKDLFLRKQMDSQGFVFLSVITDFNRIRQLTRDVELVRYACLNSQTIEFRTGSDGLDRLRARDGWKQWVLAVEERMPAARNDGPSQLHMPRMPPALTMESSAPVPRSNLPSASPTETGYQAPVNGLLPYIPIGDVPPSAGLVRAPSSHANGHANGDAHQHHIALSAGVPSFAPATQHSAINGLGITSVVAQYGKDTFSDTEVESLVIVVRRQESNSQEAAFHTAASRTYSNGSIDERMIADAIGGSKSNSIGLDSGRNLGPDAKRADDTVASIDSDSPPVFWMKGCDSPQETLPRDISHETYTSFRRDALRKRETTGLGRCSRDMDNLYQFWSHFLVRNFNTRMYEEFHSFALEDHSKRQTDVGLRNLLQYYDVSLKGEKMVSDGLARDYVALVRNEDGDRQRVGFEKLRAAWRSGSLNGSNRKKIGGLLSPDSKAELER